MNQNFRLIFTSVHVRREKRLFASLSLCVRPSARIHILWSQKKKKNE